MIDHYLSIEKPSESLLKEKSSKFYAYAYPVKTEEDIQVYIDQLKKDHLKARHYCYAYILGPDKMQFRANDDGEPSGTAGKPILGQIEKLNLTDTLVVVVRYFGGTKLGTSGLIKAYKESAAIALNQASIKEFFIMAKVLITTSFDQIGPIMNLVSNSNLEITNTDYSDVVKIYTQIRFSEAEKEVLMIKAQLLNRPVEDVDLQTKTGETSFEIIE